MWSGSNPHIVEDCFVPVSWLKIFDHSIHSMRREIYLFIRPTKNLQGSRLFADKVIRHNPMSTSSSLTCLEPWSKRSPHTTNGVLVYSNRSLNQFLLYGVLQSVRNNPKFNHVLSSAGWLSCANRMSTLCKKLFQIPPLTCETKWRILLKSLQF